MPHDSDTETPLYDAVEQRLKDEYGMVNVEREKYLPDSRRFIDFHVYAWPFNLCIEVEDDMSGMIKSVGQCYLYAQHFPNGVPMLIAPSTAVEQPELRMLRQTLPVAILDHDEWLHGDE